MLFFFVPERICKLCNLTARGWLWSSNGLQKWKAEAICDRSCIPLFSLGWSERKVRAFWIGQRKILRSKNVIDFFSLKIQWKRKILRLKIFDIFSDRKFSIFFNWIFNEKKSMKIFDFLSRNFRWSIQNALTFRSGHPREKKWYTAPIANRLSFPFLKPVWWSEPPPGREITMFANSLRDKKNNTRSVH